MTSTHIGPLASNLLRSMVACCAPRCKLLTEVVGQHDELAWLPPTTNERMKNSTHIRPPLLPSGSSFQPGKRGHKVPSQGLKA